MSSQPSASTGNNAPTSGPDDRERTAGAGEEPRIRYSLPPPPTADAFHDPRRNPPSHLDPPFAPRSPQLRPHFSDLPLRHGLYPQAPQRLEGRRWAASGPRPPQVAAPSSSGASLPPIFPRHVSTRPALSTPVFEPTSPLGVLSHQNPGRSSVFDDSTYRTPPVAHAAPQPQQSPTNSYQSSLASSSGQPSTAPLQTQASEPRGKTSTGVSAERGDNDMSERYILIVRQQPLAARACGFGERDRRVLDPPAVVQLSFKDYNPDDPSDVAELQYPFHIVHCSLFTVTAETSETQPAADVTSVPDPGKINTMCRRLMGTLVASPFVAVDPEAPVSSKENARLGCFFIFPDLSIRQTGKYRLRFTLMKVSMQNMIEGGQSTIAAAVDSDIFEVFVAGHFPGMSPSSLLIKELKRQGAAVSLKKGAPARQKRGGKDSEGSGEDGAEERESASPKSRPRKKRI